MHTVSKPKRGEHVTCKLKNNFLWTDTLLVYVFLVITSPEWSPSFVCCFSSSPCFWRARWPQWSRQRVPSFRPKRLELFLKSIRNCRRFSSKRCNARKRIRRTNGSMWVEPSVQRRVRCASPSTMNKFANIHVTSAPEHWKTQRFMDLMWDKQDKSSSLVVWS